MKGKLMFGAGVAAGYLMWSRQGQAAFRKFKDQAGAFLQSPTVQHQMHDVAETVKHKAPDVVDKVTAAARKAGAAAGSVLPGSHETSSSTSGTASGTAGAATSSSGATTSGAAGTATSSSGAPNASTPLPQRSDIASGSDMMSDPALNDAPGQSWTGEGGATPAGAATNEDRRRADAGE